MDFGDFLDELPEDTEKNTKLNVIVVDEDGNEFEIDRVETDWNDGKIIIHVDEK